MIEEREGAACDRAGRPIEHNQSPATEKAKERSSWPAMDVAFRAPSSHSCSLAAPTRPDHRVRAVLLQVDERGHHDGDDRVVGEGPEVRVVPGAHWGDDGTLCAACQKQKFATEMAAVITRSVPPEPATAEEPGTEPPKGLGRRRGLAWLGCWWSAGSLGHRGRAAAAWGGRALAERTHRHRLSVR
ncbi:hypothetical protein ACFCYM_31040 [Streptomyces sp. NPDC056254]|uniref:hypothetical protein n=1 Tax=Streptomyces sp. NPDC056254 TaxID=3345763 RepID=UPI0035D5B965